jgi:2-phospho-L-lactate/phosphoenolpyruvate guanylyltransferase
VTRAVDLVVPVKPLHLAKSRLRASLSGDDRAHRRLALAVALDTITAASSATGVRRVVAICSDPAAAPALRDAGIEVVPDEPDAGLNPALAYGAALLDPAAVRGALQADLPALRPADLDAALDALHTLGAARAFVPDRHGTGTTLLLAAPGVDLDPHFGTASAAAHTTSGAIPLLGPWPSLRCDVDTEPDLTEATRLGLGPQTTAVLAALIR